MRRIICKDPDVDHYWMDEHLEVLLEEITQASINQMYQQIESNLNELERKETE